jgi:hypothetical protein
MVQAYVPVPDPEVHRELAVVGFGVVLQQMPLEVTVELP